MNAARPLTWAIDRYARLASPSSATDSSQWKDYDDSKVPMLLTITDYDILILTQGNIVLESFNLAMNGSSLRGLVRVDSLLIAYKCKTSTRRFRLRFKPSVDGRRSGSSVCEDCVNNLSRFFVIKKHTSSITPINAAAAAVDGAAPISENTVVVAAAAAPVVASVAVAQHQRVRAVTTEQLIDKDDNLDCVDTIAQEVTFGQVAKSILSGHGLGLAYENDTNSNAPPPEVDSSTVQQLVRLCLLDPGFPAFVAGVEKAVNDVIDGATT